MVDPDIDAIIEYEEERQARKLILIPSESMAPQAVRQALGSVFNNVYAEGYPPLRMTRDDERCCWTSPTSSSITGATATAVSTRVWTTSTSSRRWRNVARPTVWPTSVVASSDIHVNVQPLSGAAANLAVYDTLLEAGDTVMGMDLYQGGHLTHGSAFNFSGKRYHVASYGVSRETGRLDYDQIRDLARRHPKMIIAGFTSYTWAPDWQAFAEIAHEVERLLADISHPAGMAIAGAFPSPVGLADVITFTTHKTLCGPRGAVIVTTDEELARQVDLAVFPGEQGGPHTQKFAAMAVAFKIAQSDAFRKMMFGIVENAAALAAGLARRGLKLAYGGTDTHFCMLDLNGMGGPKDRPCGVNPPSASSPVPTYIGFGRRVDYGGGWGIDDDIRPDAFDFGNRAGLLPDIDLLQIPPENFTIRRLAGKKSDGAPRRGPFQAFLLHRSPISASPFHPLLRRAPTGCRTSACNSPDTPPT